MVESVKCRAPSVRQINEYFENEALRWEQEGLPPQEGFVRAARAYASADSQARQVRLIEAVIRTARGLQDNHRPLPPDVKETLAAIMKKYEPFSPTKLDTVPKTFAEARQVLRTLFF